MISQPGLRIADILAKAQHDAEFFGLHAVKPGQAPDRERTHQQQRDAEAAEITARQQLLKPVLAAAQKVFEIGRPWPHRLRARTPGSLRTRAPRASALILPRHRQTPSRGSVQDALPRNIRMAL